MTKPPIKPLGTMKSDKGTETVKSADEEVVASVPIADLKGVDTSKPILSAVESLTDAELNAALKLLRAEMRRRDGEREALRPQVGSKVRILRGRPKYVGKVGTAVIVRKSRCFVTVPDIKSPAYVLVSDVELIER